MPKPKTGFGLLGVSSVLRPPAANVPQRRTQVPSGLSELFAAFPRDELSELRSGHGFHAVFPFCEKPIESLVDFISGAGTAAFRLRNLTDNIIFGCLSAFGRCGCRSSTATIKSIWPKLENAELKNQHRTPLSCPWIKNFAPVNAGLFPESTALLWVSHCIC